MEQNRTFTQIQRDLIDLANQLSAMNKGAKAHTINKAEGYLRRAADRGMGSKLEEPTRKAIVTGDWKEVEETMKFWF